MCRGVRHGAVQRAKAGLEVAYVYVGLEQIRVIRGERNITGTCSLYVALHEAKRLA